MSRSNEEMQNDKTISLLSFLVVCGTGYLSFNGYSVILNEMEVSFHNTALASIMAIISSILMWLVWARLFKEAKEFNTPHSIVALIVIALIMQGGITFVSSTPNVVGLGGELALHTHNTSELERAEQKLEALQKYDFSIRSLIPEIEMDEKRFRARGLDEYQNGTESGTKGRGAVEGSQRGIADNLLALAEQLHLASRENDKAISDAQKLLERMRREIKVATDPQVAIEKMAPLADRLRTVFLKIERRDISGLIMRSLERLPREISNREVYSSNIRVRSQQERIIGSIREALDHTTDMIEEHLESLEILKDEAPYELNRITAQAAVFLYFTDLISLWAASLTIDWTMFFILLLRIVSKHWNKKNDTHMDEVLDLTVREMKNAQIGGEMVSNSRFSKEELDRLSAHHLGHQKSITTENGDA